ncbi:plasmid mobilization relaxosome protein MobC [Aquibium carbonis]|uniref:Plasmid mobilization relaxosome protein MobC n=1 Tax=Aquibium carbonis TaxID=2495581 RepID=A0A429Z0P8_9HYPH|nr:plasmid mobilization relaxosome protein MobC [Aquibium carbonis]RST87267.1 plasmid mobilization relaxosome protein MobC [Aquibium carbonis]
MSASATFNQSASKADYRQSSRKRAAPFSIRLSPDERARLAMEAAGAPLGAYIKAKILGDGPASMPIRMRRTGLAIEDRKALSQALGLLGKSRLANNLNQLARLANTGSLPLTPEVEEELLAAFREVREIRDLLMTALGLKPERAP